ncbi:MAG: FAD-dependent oxidoreductase [Reyranellaceae bacterium]
MTPQDTDQAEEGLPAWDRSVDLLVFGSGIGGLTAALVGALEGLEALVCEKTELIGGTTAVSAGAIWMPGNRQGGNARPADDLEAAARYLDAEIGAQNEPELRAVYLASGPEVLDYLASRTEVRFALGASSPDYHSSQPGFTAAGRALITPPFDGRLLGADLARLRPPRPEFTMFGRMMASRDEIAALRRPWASIANLTLACRLVGRYLVDRLSHPRGTRLLLGNAMVGRLLYSLRQAGGRLETNAALVRLIRRNGRVVGAIVRLGDRECAIEARRGVVLATGGASREAARGIGANHSLLPEGIAGDGAKAATAVGGSMDTEHASPVYWMPVSAPPGASDAQSIFPHIAADRAKPGLIAVDAAGGRFVNEGDSYHDFVLGMLRARRARGSDRFHLVCDGSFVRDFGLGMIRPGTRDLRRFVDTGYLIVAPTLAALADRIGIDAAGLAATVARYNGFAATGVDADFGKGTNRLNRHYGDPDCKPNPCLRPIGPGPYCAVAVHAADFAASAGLRVDRNARVLDAQGAPIAGLYACGTDMSSIMRGAYPGPGTALGPALVFGWRAAMAAAGQLQGER